MHSQPQQLLIQAKPQMREQRGTLTEAITRIPSVNEFDAASMCSSPSSVKVKNTFLHFEDESSFESSPIDAPLSPPCLARARSQSDCIGMSECVRERLAVDDTSGVLSPSNMDGESGDNTLVLHRVSSLPEDAGLGTVEDDNDFVLSVEVDPPKAPMTKEEKFPLRPAKQQQQHRTPERRRRVRPSPLPSQSHGSPVYSPHSPVSSLASPQSQPLSPPVHSPVYAVGRNSLTSASSPTRVGKDKLRSGSSGAGQYGISGSGQQYYNDNRVPDHMKTTVMLKNIPNKYTQKMLLQNLKDNGFDGKFDFFYLPIDFRNKCNVGYAFVNFINPLYAAQFKKRYDGYRLPGFNSSKICAVSFARVQGLAANLEHYRNSPVNSINIEEYRPIVLSDKFHL